MKTLFFFLCLLFIHPVFALANCKLPASEKITIGCTYNKCDLHTRIRIRAAAKRLGYRVKFVDLTLTKEKDISQLLTTLDSVLIPGGADIHPKFYLNSVTNDLRRYTEENLHLVKFTEEGRKRDLFEYSLLKLYMNLRPQFKTLPVLGICRGMQMMSVAKGIPLYLDIKAELGIPNRIWKLDRINITEPDSLMSSLYGEKRFSGLELHHQGIRVDYYQANHHRYKNVLVSAYSNDGKIAEAIEYEGMTALGVQYHPEKSLPKTTYPIFKWFLTKACEHKTAPKDLL